MSKIKVLILFGRSGAGKDTVANWIIKNVPNTSKVILDTTRPKRDYEVDGVHYNFITATEYYRKLDSRKYFTSNVFNNWAYGITKNSLKENKVNVCVLDPASIKSLLEYTDKNIYDILPIFIYANQKILLLRNIYREGNPNYAEICRRFLADEKDFNNITFNYVIFDNSYNDEDFRIMNLPEMKKFMAGAV